MLKKLYSNISKAELTALHKLASDSSIVIKKADKSGSIVIMNKNDYKAEVKRQLDNSVYFEKLTEDPGEQVYQNIFKCVNNRDIEDEFDTFPDNILTAQFYILPKIHKEYDSKFPLRYPGRPIVAGCNSATENTSKYIDYTLKPNMQSLLSYIKDTSDFIQKIKSVRFRSKHSYLVTLEVNSLYTNIPHSGGLRACKFFMDGTNHSTKLSSKNIAELIQLGLENNCFQFDGESYRQCMGTAMGSSMAPAYASIFMGNSDTIYNNLIEDYIGLAIDTNISDIIITGDFNYNTTILNEIHLSPAETEDVLKSLTAHKAAGPDGISN
ncbi:uncharacterized protein LOC128557424 [Mercenaria mercenaria]|uniref:uncharacterized protein LOC128557424 n=1 Tax=Mercenaria mercenaria TaxID=6596 RepID=UPI00234F3EED|nr:uncharacterized protein LOC128557424 [Mercenaria mercenaria]